MTNDAYLPITDWLGKGYPYPSKSAFYNWTRPGPLRNELVAAGVIMQVGRRWLMNRAKFEAWCAAKAKQQSSRGAA
jgi:hypothetical protein